MKYLPHGIVIVGQPHPRNMEGMMKGAKRFGIPVEVVATTKAAAILAAQPHHLWDFFWFPLWAIEPDYHQTFRDKKIFYGPHFFVFPEGSMLLNGSVLPILCNQSIIYTCLCDWNVNVFEEFGGLRVRTMAVPFGVDTDSFQPNVNVKKKDCIFISYKARHEQDLNKTVEIVKRWKHETKQDDLEVHVLKYGGYALDEYRKLLHRSQFGIWVGSSESQGFAVQEALSCDVPLLVWDVHSMYDEMDRDNKSVYAKYKATGKRLLATTVPYWNETCGVRVFSADELSKTLPTFAKASHRYKPRQFIVNTLSIEICMRRLFDLYSLERDDHTTTTTTTMFQGFQYLNEIYVRAPELLRDSLCSQLSGHTEKKFQYLNPCDQFQSRFMASPRVLRYMKVVADLRHYFGFGFGLNNNNVQVIDLGGIYNGFFDIAQHTLQPLHYWVIHSSRDQKSDNATTTYVYPSKIESFVNTLEKMAEEKKNHLLCMATNSMSIDGNIAKCCSHGYVMNITELDMRQLQRDLMQIGNRHVVCVADIQNYIVMWRPKP